MPIWDMNLRHLQAVVRIAETGTMGAAAKAVNLTQPAITQALGKIERSIGLPLFERRHDGMAPTEAADVLVPRIAAALDHIASPHVTMSRLRAMLALADTGSYLGAAAITGLSLPSLHRAVNDLALALRRKLAQRRGKAVVLTEMGEALARAFRLAVVELQVGLDEIEALKGHEVRRIAVGAMPLSRARVLPSTISRFLRRHPQVRVTIVEGSRAELVDPLRNGAVDLMIGALREPLLEPDLVQNALFRDRLAVVARKGHPLEGRRASLADLAAFPWIVAGPGAPLRDIWERLFATGGLALPPMPVESGSVMTIRQLLIDSDLLTLLSPDQVAVEIEADWLRAIELDPALLRGGGLERTIGATTRASWRPTRVQADFLADLHTVSGQQPAMPDDQAGSSSSVDAAVFDIGK